MYFKFTYNTRCSLPTGLDSGFLFQRGSIKNAFSKGSKHKRNHFEKRFLTFASMMKKESVRTMWQPNWICLLLTFANPESLLKQKHESIQYVALTMLQGFKPSEICTINNGCKVSSNSRNSSIIDQVLPAVRLTLQQ
ncbi:hypothetical protein ACF0H5_001014 [Mactra antiquata]